MIVTGCLYKDLFLNPWFALRQYDGFYTYMTVANLVNGELETIKYRNTEIERYPFNSIPENTLKEFIQWDFN